MFVTSTRLFGATDEQRRLHSLVAGDSSWEFARRSLMLRIERSDNRRKSLKIAVGDCLEVMVLEQNSLQELFRKYLYLKHNRCDLP